MFKIFYIIILISIIFYLLNKFIFKKNITENYLTYFLPFYDTNNTELSKFYNNNENNLNYFKKKFNYDIVKFGTLTEEKYFVNNLVKYFISSSNVINCQIIYYVNKIKGLDNLNDNKINFLTLEYSSLNYYINKLKKNINNIRLVTTLYKKYIYTFTKKKYNVFKITDMPTNFIIGVIGAKEADGMYLYYNLFLKTIGFTENVDYKVIFYENMKIMFDEFNNDNCNMILLCNIFPNNEITNILTNMILQDDIILLPFDIYNEKLFLKKQPIINIDYIDQNQLSKSYLPRKFGKYSYTKFRPMIKIPFMYKILLTNINTKDDTTYKFIKFYYENYRVLNNNLQEKGYKINNIGINNYKTTYLMYHNGVIKFFRDKGYISNNSNPNCKYLVGTTECTDKSLKENNLYLDAIEGDII